MNLHSIIFSNECRRCIYTIILYRGTIISCLTSYTYLLTPILVLQYGIINPEHNEVRCLSQRKRSLFLVYALSFSLSSMKLSSKAALGLNMWRGRGLVMPTDADIDLTCHFENNYHRKLNCRRVLDFPCPMRLTITMSGRSCGTVVEKSWRSDWVALYFVVPRIHAPSSG